MRSSARNGEQHSSAIRAGGNPLVVVIWFVNGVCRLYGSFINLRRSLVLLNVQRTHEILPVLRGRSVNNFARSQGDMFPFGSKGGNGLSGWPRSQSSNTDLCFGKLRRRCGFILCSFLIGKVSRYSSAMVTLRLFSHALFPRKSAL